MAERTYDVLGQLTADRLYKPGETITLDQDAAAALIADGVLRDPDAPATPAPESAPGGLLDQTVEYLRAAPGAEVRAFLERLGEDETIRAKAEAGFDRHTRLVDAIAELDPENAEHWNADGETPNIKALEAALDVDDISAAERDAAHAAWRQATKEGGE